MYTFWTLDKIILCNSDETGYPFERGVCELAHSFFHYCQRNSSEMIKSLNKLTWICSYDGYSV